MIFNSNVMNSMVYYRGMHRADVAASMDIFRAFFQVQLLPQINPFLLQKPKNA